jgi:hypothetical protein
MSDRRLKALRRKFKAVWKERDKTGVVIEMTHAARTKGVTVTKVLFDRLTHAFEERWRSGQNTFQIWSGVWKDFPEADLIDLEYAAKFANRRIRESMDRGKKEASCLGVR